MADFETRTMSEVARPVRAWRGRLVQAALLVAAFGAACRSTSSDHASSGPSWPWKKTHSVPPAPGGREEFEDIGGDPFLSKAGPIAPVGGELPPVARELPPPAPKP